MTTLQSSLTAFFKAAYQGNVAQMHASFDKALREKLVPMLQNKQREVAQKIFKTPK